MTTEQGGAPSASAGGAPALDPAVVDNVLASALMEQYGFVPLSVRYAAAKVARAVVEQSMAEPRRPILRPNCRCQITPAPDPRDAEIERLRDDAEEANTWRIRAINAEQDLADARTSYDVALREGNEARESWKRADAEVTRLRGELAKANAGWEVWRDEQRARDKRQDNELRVVAERLHKLIGDTEPCAMAFISTRHLHGLLDRVVAEPSPEIERLRDQLGEVCTALHNQLSDYDECGVFTREHALYLVRQLGGRVRLRDMTITAMHKQMAGTNAETDRLRAELHQIRDIALIVLNVLPDDDDRSAVDLVREILENAGPEKLRRDNQFRDLVAERDRKRRHLADVTADRDRWQANYNKLIGGALAVQQHLQRAAGKLIHPSDEFDKDFSRSVVDELTAERDRLRQELDLAIQQRQNVARAVAQALSLPIGEDKKPAEPRRWVAGDPEPEVGTTVRQSGDWGAGPTWTSRQADDWHCNSHCLRSDVTECPEPGRSWAWLSGHVEALVEVVDQ